MYRHVYTMYIHICKFPFMYMTRTGIYINVQTCMYICLFVYTWYIHVHTMYVHVWHFLTCTYMLIHVYTVFPNPVQVFRIPDDVWICAPTCPVIRHWNLESQVKKTCADYDLAILCLYGYIPVYTKYNLVHTMCVQIQWQLSYFLFQGSVLLLDHASIHPPCTVQRSLQPKVKKNTCADNQVCRLGT